MPTEKQEREDLIDAILWGIFGSALVKMDELTGALEVASIDALRRIAAGYKSPIRSVKRCKR